MTLSLPVDASANELLSRSPLALLIAMLLDQQVPLEKAFSSPQVLVQRLGHEPTADELAGYDPEALAAIFSERPALHRFPKAMAARVQELGRIIADRYDGDPARVWGDAATGQELFDRLSELPGFGAYKAQIMIALLDKANAHGLTSSLHVRIAAPVVASASVIACVDVIVPAAGLNVGVAAACCVYVAVATALFVSPVSVPIAFTVSLAATAKVPL